jgi:hypothetical protein
MMVRLIDCVQLFQAENQPALGFQLMIFEVFELLRLWQISFNVPYTAVVVDYTSVFTFIQHFCL